MTTSPLLDQTAIDAFHCAGHALEVLNGDYWNANGIAVPCPLGSVTLHHSYMLHHAGPNRTDSPRRASISVFVRDPTPLAHPMTFTWDPD